jgi:hypothetical protein
LRRLKKVTSTTIAAPRPATETTTSAAGLATGTTTSAAGPATGTTTSAASPATGNTTTGGTGGLGLSESLPKLAQQTKRIFYKLSASQVTKLEKLTEQAREYLRDIKDLVIMKEKIHNAPHLPVAPAAIEGVRLHERLKTYQKQCRYYAREIGLLKMRAEALVEMQGPEQGGSEEWQLIAARTKQLGIALIGVADQMVVRDSRYVSDP